MKFINLASGPG